MGLYCVTFEVVSTYSCWVDPERLGVDDNEDAVWDYLDGHPGALETDDWIDTDINSGVVTNVEAKD